MATPSPVITNVRAVSQSGNTAWSAFGPYSKNLLISVYSDFQAMFNAFTSGQVDITDWPIQPGDLSSFCSNVDFFCTSPEGQLAIFHLNINQHGSFLGVAQQVSHTTVAASVKNTVSSSTTTCGTGFARLIVNLHNQEMSGKPFINDTLNTVAASSTSGTFTVSPFSTTDSGRYVIPSAAGCIPQNAGYALTTSVYGGSVPISVTGTGGAAVVITLDFNVNWNSQSSSIPSAAGVQINRAISHLIDTTRFVNDASLGGQAENPHFWSPPAQGYNNVCDNPVGGASGLSKICQANLNEDCATHVWRANCAPIAPYDLTIGPGGPSNYWWAANGAVQGVTDGYPSVDNLRAACDHFVLAGFSVNGGNGTCAGVAAALTGTAAPSGPYAHLNNNGQQIILYPRTHKPRAHFGTIVADALNSLFGTPNNANNPNNPAGQQTCTVNYGITSPAPGCTPEYYTITQVFDIVFSANLGAGSDDWKLYTGGNTLGSLGDDTYAEFNSQFSGGICAGSVSTYQNDYTMYCNPVFDTWTRGGEFAPNLGQAGLFFRRGFLQQYRDAFVVPVFALIQQFVALNGWNLQPGTRSSLVAQLGAGFQTGFWSLLNMRANPSYTPSNPIYNSGGGTAGLVRRGFSQNVHKLSPFQFQTLWDAEVLTQIYDTMLVANPLTGGASNQLIDWMTTGHTATFNPVETTCIGTSCVAGTTTQLWHLRNDLKWQDGVPVTADDIAYTITAYRDVPSANLEPSVASVSSASALSSRTLQVKLQHQSPFYELEIGTLPIIPKHLWAPVCGDPPNPSSPCGTPAFDPMAAGLFVGSGPWECKNLNTGIIGGSCTQNADSSLGTQDVTLGGRILLTANENYMRGPTTLQGSSLQKTSWADKNDDGFVNLLDIADAALHFGKPDPYWDHPLFGTANGVVDIGEIATIAFYFDHGITKPYPPGALTGMDPQVDPFRTDLTAQSGPVVYYEGGARDSSGNLNVKLLALSGTPIPSSFTATLLTDAGSFVSSTTGTAGSLPSVVTLTFSGLSAGRYHLQITFNGAAQPFIAVLLILT